MTSEDQEVSRTPPKQFSFMKKTVPISIKLENLSYSVKESRSKFKKILDDVSGEFFSGELTAILGAIGSGKSTLLNILSGYVKNNVKGTIKMNEEICNVKLLRKLSAYVMQSDLLQRFLTVEEQMMIVANLKLPNQLEEKKLIVDEFVDVFSLRNCRSTRVEKLSRGERKRLSIVLELISNPSIIFLDEPTSGLDSVTITLCVEIFKQLSKTGKTVICTIHQPSVSIMNQFDQVYFLARGSCVYNGSTENILPFLNSLSLNCPITWSYSEFVIETVEANPEAVRLLSTAIENGKVNNRNVDSVKNKLEGFQNRKIEDYYDTNEFRSKFWSQFIIIFRRMLLQQWRNKVGLIIQLGTYITLGVMTGLAFYGIGNNAKFITFNVGFSWMCMLFFVYLSIMTNIIVFPLEMEILRREYLNRWYGFKVYFLALSLRWLPIIVVFGTGMISFAYLLSDQPMEIGRFFRFTLTFILLGITSEGFGLAIATIFGTVGGAIVAPCVMAPIVMIPFYGFGYGNYISSTAKMMMKLSYVQLSYIASMYSLMEDRPAFNCSEIFCLYKDPKHLLRDLGITHNSFHFEIIRLTAHGLFFRVIAYLALRYRMQEELTGKNSDFIAKLLEVKN